MATTGREEFPFDLNHPHKLQKGTMSSKEGYHFISFEDEKASSLGKSGAIKGSKHNLGESPSSKESGEEVFFHPCYGSIAMSRSSTAKREIISPLGNILADVSKRAVGILRNPSLYGIYLLFAYQSVFVLYMMALGLQEAFVCLVFMCFLPFFSVTYVHRRSKLLNNRVSSLMASYEVSAAGVSVLLLLALITNRLALNSVEMPLEMYRASHMFLSQLTQIFSALAISSVSSIIYVLLLDLGLICYISLAFRPEFYSPVWNFQYLLGCVFSYFFLVKNSRAPLEDYPPRDLLDAFPRPSVSDFQLWNSFDGTYSISEQDQTSFEPRKLSRESNRLETSQQNNMRAHNSFFQCRIKYSIARLLRMVQELKGDQVPVLLLSSLEFHLGCLKIMHKHQEKRLLESLQSQAQGSRILSNGPRPVFVNDCLFYTEEKSAKDSKSRFSDEIDWDFCLIDLLLHIHTAFVLPFADVGVNFKLKVDPLVDLYSSPSRKLLLHGNWFSLFQVLCGYFDYVLEAAQHDMVAETANAASQKRRSVVLELKIVKSVDEASKSISNLVEKNENSTIFDTQESASRVYSDKMGVHMNSTKTVRNLSKKDTISFQLRVSDSGHKLSKLESGNLLDNLLTNHLSHDPSSILGLAETSMIMCREFVESFANGSMAMKYHEFQEGFFSGRTLCFIVSFPLAKTDNFGTTLYKTGRAGGVATIPTLKSRRSLSVPSLEKKEDALQQKNLNDRVQQQRGKGYSLSSEEAFRDMPLPEHAECPGISEFDGMLASLSLKDKDLHAHRKISDDQTTSATFSSNIEHASPKAPSSAMMNAEKVKKNIIHKASSNNSGSSLLKPNRLRLSTNASKKVIKKEKNSFFSSFPDARSFELASSNTEFPLASGTSSTAMSQRYPPGYHHKRIMPKLAQTPFDTTGTLITLKSYSDENFATYVLKSSSGGDNELIRPDRKYPYFSSYGKRAGISPIYAPAGKKLHRGLNAKPAAEELPNENMQFSTAPKNLNNAAQNDAMKEEYSVGRTAPSAAASKPVDQQAKVAGSSSSAAGFKAENAAACRERISDASGDGTAAADTLHEVSELSPNRNVDGLEKSRTCEGEFKSAQRTHAEEQKESLEDVQTFDNIEASHVENTMNHGSDNRTEKPFSKVPSTPILVRQNALSPLLPYQSPLSPARYTGFSPLLLPKLDSLSFNCPTFPCGCKSAAFSGGENNSTAMHRRTIQNFQLPMANIANPGLHSQSHHFSMSGETDNFVGVDDFCVSAMDNENGLSFPELPGFFGMHGSSSAFYNDNNSPQIDVSNRYGDLSDSEQEEVLSTHKKCYRVIDSHNSLLQGVLGRQNAKSGILAFLEDINSASSSKLSELADRRSSDYASILEDPLKECMIDYKLNELALEINRLSVLKRIISDPHFDKASMRSVATQNTLVLNKRISEMTAIRRVQTELSLFKLGQGKF